MEIDSSRLGLNEDFVTKGDDSDSKEGTPGPSPFVRNDENRRSKKSSKSDKSLKSTKASLHLPLDFNKVFYFLPQCGIFGHFRSFFNPAQISISI